MGKPKKAWADSVDDEDIVRSWMGGLSAAEIAQKIGKTKSSVTNRILRMRKAGVHLPRRRKGLDVGKLNRLITHGP